ncbi:MAG: zinc-binding dehydrogenase [Nitrospinota bacterium]|nr:zinc-binding dehydrogenase [Nitrospinota bacterium]
MSKIIAAEMLEPGQIILKDFPEPEVGDDAILMKVAAVGICGSDKHMYTGKMNVAWPLIPGHEFSGIIEKIGNNANNSMKIVGGILKEGDRITVTPGSQACSKCWFCVHVPHRPQLCPNRTVFGFRTSKDSPHLFGAFSEYMYIPGNSFVLKLPEELTLERATLCEPLSVAQRAVSRALSPGIPNAGEGIGIGVRCAVMGVGPIGLLVVATLRSMGVGKIIAVDASKKRLSFSEKFGATDLINISETDEEQRKEGILSLTDNVGPDVVLECAGVPAAFSEGLNLVRRGGKLVEVGHYGDPGSVEIRPHQVCNKDVDILGSWAYPQVQFEPAIEMLLRTVLTIDDIFTHEMTLDNIEEGIQITGSSECLKVLVRP